jgi:predicted ribosome quality control (RQC) complex YloA/Tae2 family protein
MSQMFMIDVSLKNAPVTLSVQRKSLEAAEALYQQILAAIQTGSPTMLELTCEQQTEKKVAILTAEVAAVQMFEKSGTAASSGRPPGFFAIAE